MEIKKLPDDVTNRLRSDIQVNTFPHCVTELVLNSLDAKSTAIAVRVNLLLFRIEVIDNGAGINASNMEHVGFRYMTSKYDSKCGRKQKLHGYKGESLASIISSAKHVEISSRSEDSDDTYYKKFTSGKPGDIVVTKQRPSKGTTVTIVDFLHNCPVRQRRVTKIDINNIQKDLELLAIIHPNVSFTLRNDESCDIILNCPKAKSVSHSLCNLYTDLKTKNFCEVKVGKGNIHITGLFYLSSVFHAKLQLFYINKLPVALEYLQKNIKKDLHQNLPLEFITTNCCPAYVININCPYSKVDIYFDSTKYLAEFKSWNVITKSIEKMTKMYIDKYKRNKPAGSIIQHSVKSNETVKQKKTLGIRHKHKKKTIDKLTSPETNNNDDDHTINFKCFANNIVNEDKRYSNECLMGMFDEYYDSQTLTLKRCSYNNLDHNEKEGKKVIMDTFFKSLTDDVKKDNVEERVIEIYENTLATTSNKSFEKSQTSNKDGALAEMDIKITHKRDISQFIKMSEDQSKKRQLEKLNGVGTLLIEKKLKLQSDYRKADEKSNTIKAMSDIESISWGSIKTASQDIPKTNGPKGKTKPKEDQFSRSISPIIGMSSSSQKITSQHNKRIFKKYKTVATSPISIGGNLRRSYSNKEIQTNFSFLLEAKSVQVDFLQNEFNFRVTPVALNKHKKIKILDDVRLIPGPDPLLIKRRKNYFSPAKNLDATFNSHYNASKEFNISNKKAVHIDTKKVNKNVPIVEMNTQKLYNDITIQNVFNTDKELFKQPTDPDVGYKEFVKGMKPITPNHQLSNSRNGNISTFFNTPRKSDFKFLNNPNHTLPANKNTTVVFADTSMFNSEKDRFAKPKTIIDKNFHDDTNVTFGHFEPAFKSTLKEPKYTDKNNYFESFLFNETKIDEKFFDFGDDTNNIEKQFRNAFFQEFGENIDKSEKNQEPLYSLKKRYDFMPKGLSPILKETKIIDVTLSPTSKKQLNNAIIETYENELDLIKWQDYIDGDNPREFFNKIYAEKQKLIQKDIPNVTKAMKNFTFSDTGAFTKDIFNSIVVIGQLDKKFIVTLLDRKVLLLFDQHAVHERIRLEKLLNDYTIKDSNGNQMKFKSIFCSKYIRMQFNARELQCLMYCKDIFGNLGFLFDVHTSSIEIKKIPECIHNKHLKEPTDEFLYNCIQNVINEQISVLEETRGVSVTIPKMMQYIISNEACRGAIKFGQDLTNQECSEYINVLSKCQLPFQCAHGRPTLYPIYEINDDISSNIKINFERLYP